jgi:hypothetical protein
MRAMALPALGKIVGQWLNGKLMVILWNHRVNLLRVGGEG